MRLSLKTKFTLATSVLVLAVVAVVSGLYLGRLTRQVLRQADDLARFDAQQLFLSHARTRSRTRQSLTAIRTRFHPTGGFASRTCRVTLDGSSTLNSTD